MWRNNMIIKAKPLTSEKFASYGQVLAASGENPERLAYAAKMENLRAHARPNMTFMRVQPVPMPVQLVQLERHAYSNQTFIPINGTRHLIAVCPATDNGFPDVSKLVAFAAEGSQTVNYNAGIWHAPRTALTAPGEFVMFRWDEDNDADTELYETVDHIEVTI